MTAIRLTLLLVVVTATSCSPHVPTATVELIDTTLSITPRAERAALDAVGAQISHLGRGDQLIVIPITGDAENDAGGHILRLRVPTKREPYDADLRRFQEDARARLAEWSASLGLRRSRTDILGTLDVARQELAALPHDVRSRLIVASDFLEDDQEYRFISDHAIGTPESARAAARRAKEQRGFALGGVPICLGRLESTDAGLLPPKRNEAIAAFWAAYLSEAKTGPDIRVDGVEALVSAGEPCFGREK